MCVCACSCACVHVCIPVYYYMQRGYPQDLCTNKLPFCSDIRFIIGQERTTVYAHKSILASRLVH